MKSSHLTQRPGIALKAIFVSLLSSGAAFAHHPNGMQLPDSFATGFMSGMGHPVIGLDHLAFVIAVGLLSLRFEKRFLMPLAFVVTTVLGTLLHISGVNIPTVELMIGISVLLAGGAAMFRNALSWKVAAGLFAVSGLFHGYAYGESIYGAEATPLLSYLAGFAAIQYGISVAVMEAVRVLGKSTVDEPSPAMRLGGAMVAGIAVVFIHGHVIPV